MDKADLKEIKTIIDSALETHLASVHEEISDLRNEMDRRFVEVDEKFAEAGVKFEELGAKIDHVNERLGNFENREVDKRMQLEVRVGRIEKHVGLPKHA
jgi:uncharacterized coiled-coil DUF342 family protein